MSELTVQRFFTVTYDFTIHTRVTRGNQYLSLGGIAIASIHIGNAA
jgi:uncharacterized Zn finger protein